MSMNQRTDNKPRTSQTNRRYQKAPKPPNKQLRFVVIFIGVLALAGALFTLTVRNEEKNQFDEQVQLIANENSGFAQNVYGDFGDKVVVVELAPDQATGIVYGSLLDGNVRFEWDNSFIPLYRETSQHLLWQVGEGYTFILAGSIDGRYTELLMFEDGILVHDEVAYMEDQLINQGNNSF